MLLLFILISCQHVQNKKDYTLQELMAIKTNSIIESINSISSTLEVEKIKKIKKVEDYYICQDLELDELVSILDKFNGIEFYAQDFFTEKGYKENPYLPILEKVKFFPFTVIYKKENLTKIFNYDFFTKKFVEIFSTEEAFITLDILYRRDGQILYFLISQPYLVDEIILEDYNRTLFSKLYLRSFRFKSDFCIGYYHSGNKYHLIDKKLFYSKISLNNEDFINYINFIRQAIKIYLYNRDRKLPIYTMFKSRNEELLQLVNFSFQLTLILEETFKRIKDSIVENIYYNNEIDFILNESLSPKLYKTNQESLVTILDEFLKFDVVTSTEREEEKLIKKIDNNLTFHPLNFLNKNKEFIKKQIKKILNLFEELKK